MQSPDEYFGPNDTPSPRIMSRARDHRYVPMSRNNGPSDHGYSLNNLPSVPEATTEYDSLSKI